MILLTWHGTFVCLRGDGRGLAHLPLPIVDKHISLLNVNVESLASDGKQNHPELGPVVIKVAPTGTTISILRYGRFLCADDRTTEMAFNREFSDNWERFQLLSQEEFDAIRTLLVNRWINPITRRVLRKSELKLLSGFRLQVGSEQLAVSRRLHFSQKAGRIYVGEDDRLVELTMANPRGSALLRVETWPTRARRHAEQVVLAVHRYLGGSEPAQEVFDRDVSSLMNDELNELSALIERLRSPPEETNESETSKSRQFKIGIPVVALGTTCITACALREMGLEAKPMPFDWLATSTGMIRHCLESDFAVLLDRREYMSLTGQSGIGEPEDGCRHDFYAKSFNIPRVFNHMDPTREVDYRYLTTSVERFQELMTSDCLKAFVQIGHYSEESIEEFERTCASINRKTLNGSFLQIAVCPPNRRMALPAFSPLSKKALHALYRFQPLSQAGGEWFRSKADNDQLQTLIAAHGRWLADSALIAETERDSVMVGMTQFEEERPKGPAGVGLTSPAVVKQVTTSLHRFLEQVGMPQRYKLGVFDKAKIAKSFSSETCLVQSTPLNVVFRMEKMVSDPWKLLYRSLPLFYLLDLINADGQTPEARFKCEFGDVGILERSVTYMSANSGTCLLPDPSFVSTGGYRNIRRQSAIPSTNWSLRQQTILWRQVLKSDFPTTGASLEGDISSLRQLTLCDHARRSPFREFLDVGVFGVVNANPNDDAGSVGALDFLRAPVPASAVSNYRAVLVSDGDSQAWSATACALLGGCCLLIIESPDHIKHWYSHYLQPWRHFIPVAADLHDLDQQVDWVVNNDSQVQEIAESGRILMSNLDFFVAMKDAAERLRAWMFT